MKESKQQKWQRIRWENRLCVRCGKPVEKSDGIECSRCAAKRKANYLKTPRKRRKCGICGKLGHNRTTCKERT